MVDDLVDGAGEQVLGDVRLGLEDPGEVDDVVGHVLVALLVGGDESGAAGHQLLWMGAGQ